MGYMPSPTEENCEGKSLILTGWEWIVIRDGISSGGTSCCIFGQTDESQHLLRNACAAEGSLEKLEAPHVVERAAAWGIVLVLKEHPEP